jgi:hypothetical protein
LHSGSFYSALGPASYKMAQPTQDFRSETENRGHISPFAAGGFIGRIRPASGEGPGKVLPRMRRVHEEPIGVVGWWGADRSDGAMMRNSTTVKGTAVAQTGGHR